MPIYSCPICNSEDIIVPTGSRYSKILMIQSVPSVEDLKYGKPFQGSLGGMLRTEFAFYKMDFHVWRMTSLWIHPKNENPECLNYSISEIMKEIRGKKLVILMGVDAVKYFTGKSPDNTTSLFVKSNYFSIPTFIMENPLSVFSRDGVVGELRLSIRKVAEYIEKEKLNEDTNCM